jgi:hypothetical protein
MPRIQKQLEGLSGGKRGLASLRVLPDSENTFELTWKDVVGYMSVFSFCTMNLEGQPFTLNCRDEQQPQAVHIENPRVLITILKFGI